MDASGWAQAGALAGAGLCMGFGAIGAAVAEGGAAGSALGGIERQPAATDHQLRLMLVGQAMAETASVFALIVAFLLIFLPAGEGGWVRGVGLLSAGICMGVGALGPGLGAGPPAARAVDALARNPRRRQKILTVMLVGQAIAQTPALFSLMVSLLLLYAPVRPTGGVVEAAALAGAGLCMGIGGLGPGMGAGWAAAAAVDGTARRPAAANLILRTMVTGQAVAQTTAVYALVIALLLLRIV